MMALRGLWLLIPLLLIDITGVHSQLNIISSTSTPGVVPSYVQLTFSLANQLVEGDTIVVTPMPAELLIADANCAVNFVAINCPLTGVTGASSALTVTLGSGCNLVASQGVTLNVSSCLGPNLDYSVPTGYGLEMSNSGGSGSGSTSDELSFVLSTNVPGVTPAYLLLSFPVGGLSLTEGDNILITPNPTSLFLASTTCGVTMQGSACSLTGATDSSSILTVRLGPGCSIAAGQHVTLNITLGLGPNPLSGGTGYSVHLSTSATLQTSTGPLSISTGSTAPGTVPLFVMLTFVLGHSFTIGDSLTVTATPASVFLTGQINVEFIGWPCQMSAYTNSDGVLTAHLDSACSFQANQELTLKITSGLGMNPPQGVVTYTLETFMSREDVAVENGQSVTFERSTAVAGQTPAYLALSFTPSKLLFEGTIISVLPMPYSLFIAGTQSVAVEVIGSAGVCSAIASINTDNVLTVKLGVNCALPAEERATLNVTSGLGPNPAAGVTIMYTVSYLVYYQSETQQTVTAIAEPPTPGVVPTSLTLMFTLTVDIYEGNKLTITAQPNSVFVYWQDPVDIQLVGSDCTLGGSVYENVLIAQLQPGCTLAAGANLTIVITSGLGENAAAGQLITWSWQFFRSTFIPSPSPSPIRPSPLPSPSPRPDTANQLVEAEVTYMGDGETISSVQLEWFTESGWEEGETLFLGSQYVDIWGDGHWEINITIIWEWGHCPCRYWRNGTIWVPCRVWARSRVIISIEWINGFHLSYYKSLLLSLKFRNMVVSRYWLTRTENVTNCGEQLSINATGCRDVTFYMRFFQAAENVQWAVRGGCPITLGIPGSLTISSNYFKTLCLAPGAYSYTFENLAKVYSAGFVSASLVEGDHMLIGMQRITFATTQVAINFTVPAGDACVVNVNVTGCRRVQVALNAGWSPSEAGWYIPQMCPSPYANPFTLTGYQQRVFCLAPGDYSVVTVDQWNNGWGGGWLAVTLLDQPKALLPFSRVNGAGGVFNFTVPAGDACEGMVRPDAEGCRSVNITVQIGSTATRSGWHLPQVCPFMPVLPSAQRDSTLSTTAVCLPPGTYTPMGYDTHGGGFWYGWMVSTLVVPSPLVLTTYNRPRTFGELPSIVVPAGDRCEGLVNVDTPGCRQVKVWVDNWGWSVEGACPSLFGNPSGYNSFTYCLAPGKYTFDALTPTGSSPDRGWFAVTLVGSPLYLLLPPTVPTVGMMNNTRMDLIVPSGPICDGAPNVDVFGCRTVDINFDIGVNTYGGGWYVEGACPSVAVLPGTYINTPQRARSVRACLVPGKYTWVGVDHFLRSEGWLGGWATITMSDNGQNYTLMDYRVPRRTTRVEFVVPRGDFCVNGRNVGATGCRKVRITVFPKT